MPKLSDTDTYWSKLYDNGRDFTLISSGALATLLSFTDSALPKTCLDVGCGTGQLTRELHHRGYQCVGVDAAASAVQIASQLTVAPRDLLQYVRFDIEHDDITRLPHQPYSFITCKLVYAFIIDKIVFLERVRSLLSPGGVFVVMTPHVADLPTERRNIAVDDGDLALLSSDFKQLALYKGNEPGGALTYFVGQ